MFPFGIILILFGQEPAVCSRSGTSVIVIVRLWQNVPDRVHFMLTFQLTSAKFPIRNMEAKLEIDRIERQATLVSQAFAKAIKDRRRILRMTQDELALATGVGRRFIIELEAGKSTAQIGRSLLVAQRLGLSLPSTLQAASTQDTPDLPDMEDEIEEADDVGPSRSL